jgi:hypothetical protein
MSASIISLLIRGRVIGVVEGIVLERPIESGTVIRGQRETFLQSVNQVGVADEVPAIKKSIVFSGLDYTPRVLIVPTAGREKGG